MRPSISNLERRVKHEHNSLRNHLLSIHKDSDGVNQVKDFFITFPLYANLRNGLWYNESFKGHCYFKSTDGHFNHEVFSTSRLNLDVAIAASHSNGIIIVDSTTRGKAYPDSMTATIPIWCGVINAIVFRNGHGFALQYYPPVWISSSHTQQVCTTIQYYIDTILPKEYISMLQNKLKDVLIKPLRPVWCCANVDGSIDWTMTSSSDSDNNHSRDNNSSSTDYENFLEGLLGSSNNSSNNQSSSSSQLFVPVVMYSASAKFSETDRIAWREEHSWMYIQGAGDDEENWSMGLTPSLFWGNTERLLLQPSEQQLEHSQQLKSSHSLDFHNNSNNNITIDSVEIEALVRDIVYNNKHNVKIQQNNNSSSITSRRIRDEEERIHDIVSNNNDFDNPTEIIISKPTSDAIKLILTIKDTNLVWSYFNNNAYITHDDSSVCDDSNQLLLLSHELIQSTVAPPQSSSSSLSKELVVDFTHKSKPKIVLVKSPYHYYQSVKRNPTTKTTNNSSSISPPYKLIDVPTINNSSSSSNGSTYHIENDDKQLDDYDCLVIYASSDKKYRAFMLEYFDSTILPAFIKFLSSSSLSITDCIGDTKRCGISLSSSSPSSQCCTPIFLIATDPSDYGLLTVLSAAALLALQPAIIPFQRSSSAESLVINDDDDIVESSIVDDHGNKGSNSLFAAVATTIKKIYTKNEVRFSLSWIQQQQQQQQPIQSSSSSSSPTLPLSQPTRSMTKLLEAYFSR